MTNVLRVIVDPPAAGPWNMAVDDVLLNTAAATGQATLRFYEWSEPTLSLGYFQSTRDREQHPASRECPLVRRDSGGGAILHDRELTYSIAIPEKLLPQRGAKRLYEDCHRSLITTLADYGLKATLHVGLGPCATERADSHREPFLCFQRRTCFDVVLSDAKIAGSAQRRRRCAVLQHGSILLARSTFAPELPGIEDVSGKRLEAGNLAAAWLPHLAAALRMPVARDCLSGEERQKAAVLSASRFCSPDHLERR